IQVSWGREYVCTSSARKTGAASRLALSAESLPWTTFRSILRPKSARIVPGSALAGSVAPIVLRTIATAFSPSHTIATDGPDVTYSTSPSKNGFPRCPPSGLTRQNVRSRTSRLLRRLLLLRLDVEPVLEQLLGGGRVEE